MKSTIEFYDEIVETALQVVLYEANNMGYSLNNVDYHQLFVDTADSIARKMVAKRNAAIQAEYGGMQ